MIKNFNIENLLPPHIASDIGKQFHTDQFSRMQWDLWPGYYRQRISSFSPATRTLDLGCGAGAWSVAAAEISQVVVGMDLSVTRIEAAKRISQALGAKNTSFFVRDIKHTLEKENSTDLVIIYNALGAVPKWWEVLDETYRVLKPGGSLFVSSHDIGYLLFVLCNSLISLDKSKFRAGAANVVKAFLSLFRISTDCPNYISKANLISELKKRDFTLIQRPLTRGVFPNKWFGLPFFYELHAEKR